MQTERRKGAQKQVCGILIAQMPSVEEALKTARSMRKCPHVLATGVSGDRFCSVLVVPENKRWWLEYPQTKPGIIGAKKADLTLMDELVVPERFRPRIDSTRPDKAPCGADCLECPLREQYGCEGCQATTRYMKHA